MNIIERDYNSGDGDGDGYGYGYGDGIELRKISKVGRNSSIIDWIIKWSVIISWIFFYNFTQFANLYPI